MLAHLSTVNVVEWVTLAQLLVLKAFAHIVILIIRNVSLRLVRALPSRPPRVLPLPRTHLQGVYPVVSSGVPAAR